MRIVLAAVGRMKAGPERELLDRYWDRSRAVGRALGVSGFDRVEVDEGRGRTAEERRREEASALAARIPAGAATVVLDERGTSLPSLVFARRVGTLIEAGTPVLALVIGGPDGLYEAVRSGAGEVVSFGAATLPHQLVRVIAAEQLYRAFTILARHPYHRP